MVETISGLSSSDQVDPISVIPNFTPINRASWEPIKDQLPASLFAKNRARLFSLFKKQVPVSEQSRAVAFLKGSVEVPLYSSDFNYPDY